MHRQALIYVVLCTFPFQLQVIKLFCLQKEGTTLLLADIFSTCFGWEPIKLIKECMPTTLAGSRIDTKYVNNPELSDVTFRVEGRLFYAHKIVLVTASPRLRAMLSSKLCEGGLPTVQINDIRYHIFQVTIFIENKSPALLLRLKHFLIFITGSFSN